MTSEYRTVIAANGGAGWYNLIYTYDLSGNRTGKIDVLHDRTDVYHYDQENPQMYGSKNDRRLSEHCVLLASCRGMCGHWRTVSGVPQSGMPRWKQAGFDSGGQAVPRGAWWTITSNGRCASFSV